MPLAHDVHVTSSRSLNEDLLRADAYPTAMRGQTVELIETHISSVFLLRNDVFKLKKPVNLGFLDFRTLEQRRRACEAEVELNRRLAPDVYVGVVPVRRDDGGRARIDGSGPIIDWAVHMVRLPDSLRADRLLETRALTPAIVDRIAQRLAWFHGRCRSDGETAQFGAQSVLARNVEENFAQTANSIRTFIRGDQAAEIMRWQRSFLRNHEQLLDQRATTGHVRDGHGDLRLEHVYIEGDRITILDCIEFNERFRFADVCADIAFLSMDLAAHGRVDLAERLLATYAKEADDFDLYALVDFYEAYRAYVRGKIATMVAFDPTMTEGARERATKEARRYFLLALVADRRSLLLPSVVAVGGTIASGKSTVAECIGNEITAPVIDADRTRKAMLGVPPTQRIDDPAWSGAYDPAFTMSVYREVLRRAGVVLRSGRPVVIDASFRAAAARGGATALARAHGVPIHFVECLAPTEVCRARLKDRERVHGVSDGRLAIFDAFNGRFEPMDELPSNMHTVIDTTKPLAETLERLRAEIVAWPSGFVA